MIFTVSPLVAATVNVFPSKLWMAPRTRLGVVCANAGSETVSMAAKANSVVRRRIQPPMKSQAKTETPVRRRMTPPDIQLRSPDSTMLPDYVAALETGWSPSTTMDLSGEHLQAIRTDPVAFVSGLQEPITGTITLKDGRIVPRIPGAMFWIWQDGFCGQINLRYQPGTLDLPPHVSGHVGYSIVPWKQRRGI